MTDITFNMSEIPSPTLMGSRKNIVPSSRLKSSISHFNYSETRLPAIERLEGFHPGVPASTAALWSSPGQRELNSRLCSMWESGSQPNFDLSVAPAGLDRI